MANIDTFSRVSTKSDGASAFMVGTLQLAVPLGSLIDVDAEKAKIEAELEHLEKFLAGIRKKLSNEKFVANAPEKVVELERKKEKDSEEKIKSLKETLQGLK